jgi:hypothetical protein
MSYLQADASSGTYTGYNPLPDPTDWSLSVPGGVTIQAGGKVSLLRVAVQPKENRLWIDYATKPDQNGPEMATYLLVSGFTQPPPWCATECQSQVRSGRPRLGDILHIGTSNNSWFWRFCLS